MKEVVHTTPESLPLAQQVGRNVLVTMQLRSAPDEHWQGSDYEPWTGTIRKLPDIPAVNGYVNVMPDEPRVEPYPNLYPRVVNLSPHPHPETDMEARYVLYDFAAGTFGSMLVDRPSEQ